MKQRKEYCHAYLECNWRTTICIQYVFSMSNTLKEEEEKVVVHALQQHHHHPKTTDYKQANVIIPITSLFDHIINIHDMSEFK